MGPKSWSSSATSNCTKCQQASSRYSRFWLTRRLKPGLSILYTCTFWPPPLPPSGLLHTFLQENFVIKKLTWKSTSQRCNCEFIKCINVLLVLSWVHRSKSSIYTHTYLYRSKQWILYTNYIFILWNNVECIGIRLAPIVT